MEGTNRTLCTRTLEEGAVTPQGLTQTGPCAPGISGRGVGQWCHAAGLGILSAGVHARDLLKEVTIIFISSTIVWLLVKKQGGNTALLSTENWIIEHWPHPSEQDPVFPSVSLSHQDASINLLSLTIKGRQNKNHNHRKLIKLITWATALYKAMKL